MDVKRLKLVEEEDRISDLPDSMIHHILSFLPSTREAIQTGILSKRWRNQWTCVPVLIFDSPSYGMYSNQSDQNFLRLIENSLPLYDCSKMNKLQLGYNFKKDPDFASKISFATRKHVDKLILDCYFPFSVDCYLLPEFLLDNSSLVELKMSYCFFRLDWSVNWGSLKSLEIVGWGLICRPSIGKLVFCCPLLESLEFRNSNMGMNGDDDDDDVIASKSLKRLILVEITIDHHMKISCPNLAELVICPNHSYGLPDKMIEISCPNLESVELHSSGIQTYKLVNCPSLVYADLDFEIHTSENGENVAKQNLQQLQHVKELTIRSWFIKILSALEMEGLSYRMLNNKNLTLRLTNFEQFLGIECALRSSPALERLVIKLPVYVGRMTADLSDLYEPCWDLNDCGENYYSNSNETDFNCSVSHLKFVKIFGLNKRDAKSKLVINFIEFLLKNARVLEKLVLVISKDRGTDFGYKVSQKVLNFPRRSRYAIVDLLYS
ncbi:putative F-box/LRR-repeat protein At3g18150 [Euphorbia lathyris]|uniref:putative F-box/LRR-repeat protein At3g18150 n=1 Tax=Euphorbia lathyris TaxID=212925 RepID=UPI003313DA1B